MRLQEKMGIGGIEHTINTQYGDTDLGVSKEILGI